MQKIIGDLIDKCRTRQAKTSATPIGFGNGSADGKSHLKIKIDQNSDPRLVIFPSKRICGPWPDLVSPDYSRDDVRGASLSGRGSTLLTTLSKIEGRPMGLYLEEVG
jgi:hypothetical protein